VKVVIYSDLQATESQEKLRSDPSMPLQRWRVTRFYEKLVGIMEKHRAHAVWDLGDTLDDRSEIPVQTIQAVTDMLDLAAPDPSKSFKLVGNHEQHYKNAGVHSGGMFKRWFNVVDRPQVFILETNRFALDVACLPFPSTEDNLDESIDFLASQCYGHRKKILLGHLDVQGAKYPSGETILAGLKSTHLSKFDLCLFGHVHKHQQLAENAWYVGSPFQQDFTERDQPKYVCILDLSTLELAWEELTDFPQYRYGTIENLSHLLAGEDRIHVVLKNEADAAAYYAHPFHKDATVSYAYAASNAAEATSASPSVGTQDYYLEEWIRRHPLDGVDAAELLQIGKDIIST
jgi:hypothetical protein